MKGKKLVNWNFKSPEYLKVRFDKHCEKYNLHKTNWLLNAIRDKLNQEHPDSPVAKMFEYQCRLGKITLDNHCLYSTSNVFVTVIRMNKVSMALHNELDLLKTNIIIDNYLELNKVAPDYLKESLRKDIRKIKLLKNPDFLMPYMKEWQAIKDFIGFRK